MQSILEFRLQQGVVEDVDGGAAVMVVLMEIDAGSSSLKSPSLLPSIVYGGGEIYGGLARRQGSAMRGLGGGLMCWRWISAVAGLRRVRA